MSLWCKHTRGSCTASVSKIFFLGFKKSLNFVFALFSPHFFFNVTPQEYGVMSKELSNYNWQEKNWKIWVVILLCCTNQKKNKTKTKKKFKSTKHTGKRKTKK